MTFNKPPEWGKRFAFPENVQVEYNGYMGSVTSEIAVKMAERYEDAVVKQIAMEAKLAGIAECTVLNKAAILDALNKQTPKKPTDIAKNELYGRCAVCGQIVHIGNRYCDQCGQALNWEELGGTAMNIHDATETAYKNGYAQGMEDAVKWISVKDRLPEDNERVLVYHDDGVIRFGINKGGFADVVSSLYLKHNHRTCFSKVTHWMPLPEPPKGE